jgi:hypothetical protein
MIGGIEGFAIVLGSEVELGGDVELVPFLLAAPRLEIAQLGGFFFAAAGETGFLEVQIVELLFVGEIGVEIDEAGAERSLLIVKLVSEVETAFGVDGALERGDAAQTPGDIGKRLHDGQLLWADGPEFVLKVEKMALIFFGVIGGEKNGMAGERGLDGVEGGFGFSFRSFGTGG